MATPDIVGIVVRDMAQSLAFYRLLGMDIPVALETDDHVEVILPGGFRIAWDAIELMKSLNPDWVDPVGRRMGMAFKCESPAEVDALYQKVITHGYEAFKAPWDAFWGQRYAVVIDPDGNHVDLFAGQIHS